MENLNAEQIKCGLEHCTATGYKCEECPYFYKSEGIKSSMEILMIDALALINSQEQKIFELENRLKECENGYEGTLHLERCKLHDAEEKVKELTAENEKLTINMNAYGLTAKRLGEDNERLRGILLQFTDIVHKWGNKHGYDTSEISLAPILNEESEIKKKIRKETIKEFQSRLNEQRGYDDDWNYNSWWGETINQIAKEMLE